MEFLNTWRLALRIARRDALRAKGRSILVIAMIALPIIGVTAIDISFRSSQLTTEEQIDRAMGAADAHMFPGAPVPLLQDPEDPTQWTTADEADGETAESGTDADPEAEQPNDEQAARDIAALFPGAELVVEHGWYGAEVTTAGGLAAIHLREWDLDDPLTGGSATLREGRAPREQHEAAATTAFLEVAGLAVGDTVAVRGFDGEFTLTGSYELPGDLDTEQLTVLPGTGVVDTLAAEPGAEEYLSYARYFVTSDTPVDWDAVQKANERGWIVDSRAVRLDPPPRDEVPYFAAGHGWSGGGGSAPLGVVLVLALVILEICLLAGPAFAVGARRSRRMLGLMGANGADRRHVRAVMLAGGALLGLAAAVIGLLLGFAAALLAWNWLEESAGSRFGDLTVNPLELLAICALGVGTGLLAALLPALAASRSPILESLTGRRGVRRTGRELPIAGGLFFVLGTAVAVLGALFVSNAMVVVAGVVVAQLGLVATTPVLVGLFGRVGRFLPLSGRLAVRDAVRNRSRTAPAVAAVLAAVSGAVAVATVVASTNAENAAAYRATVPSGGVVISSDRPGDLPAATESALRTLPVTELATIGRLADTGELCHLLNAPAECAEPVVQLPAAAVCDREAFETGFDAARAEDPELTVAEYDPACVEDWWVKTPTWSPVSVAGPELLRVMEIDDPDAAAALERDEAVVYDERQVHEDGTLRLAPLTREEQDREQEPRPEDVAALPATVGKEADYGARPGEVLVTAAWAEANGYRVVDEAVVVATDRDPTDAEVQALREALSSGDGSPGSGSTALTLHVEEGHTSDSQLVLLILGLFATVVTLGAAGIATGLAQADSEADLATLSAVGAPPRVRRTLSGLQCGVIALMGVVLGSLAGLVPGAAIRLAGHQEMHELWRTDWYGGPETEPQLFLEIPWGTILQLVFVVPLLAAVVAALMTRSTPAVNRREQ
ncbi:FtsX-like permease family protein [Streptomyces lonarensis]|uniref:FtsX-like permease family protein n=2 Tax=Streptomyces lonarensis TaxID=700599 RepID=A0A7X6D1G8_9ACTN|nr:FtsX-like permease family protein [Streptomyces lonarensis]NJQ06325.1 FtsX-like permease family protein [Streptomyces lonarensis]